MAAILIVEDQKLQKQLIQLMLSEDHTIVGTVQSGDDAIEAVRDLHPDVVIMDLDIQGKNGLEATKNIKREYPQIPVIISSGYVNIELRFKSFIAGATDYLVKPYNQHELLDVIGSVLTK
jgi:two-component system chemotaxis response regulator CheY